MLIILTGPDSYRSLHRLEQLREAFRAKYDASGLNTVTLDGETATLAQLRDALMSGGLFSSRRMVILNSYEPKRATMKPAAVKEVLANHVSGHELIVIIRDVTSPSNDRRKKVATPKTWAIKGATIEEFPLLSPALAEKWLLTEAKHRNISLSSPVAKRLVTIIGPDAWRLHQELEKLGAYAVGRAVTVEDVDTVTIDRVESDVFALLDSIGNKKTAAALLLIRRELQAGTHPLALVTSLTRHVEHLLGAKALAPASTATIAKELGIHPYVATKAVAQARQFEQPELVRWHQTLFEIDRQLKSSSLDAETLLMSLIGRNYEAR